MQLDDNPVHEGNCAYSVDTNHCMNVATSGSDIIYGLLQCCGELGTFSRGKIFAH